MGNCQAAEAATVIIQHPQDNKIERIYWSVSAQKVMNSNPGHYVALIVNSSTLKSPDGTPLKHLKLLRPEDTLLMGHVYRLISFEDVLKEFAAKKCVKLGKLLKQRGSMEIQMKNRDNRASNPSAVKVEKEVHRVANNGRSKAVGRHSGGGQWRPALHSIAEVGN
ncbi:hypothetical protein QN277_027977 [Acacia crassicarpa]|uniref:DUF4228 domain protein n=1 Tax=Acacia crassicarpa TaxID=499986 RepID=A0AAE1K2T6_9FABA|nr:hypothetical protein QN277_027977 [Acacia crassicarpa]